MRARNLIFTNRRTVLGLTIIGVILPLSGFALVLITYLTSSSFYPVVGFQLLLLGLFLVSAFMIVNAFIWWRTRKLPSPSRVDRLLLISTIVFLLNFLAAGVCFLAGGFAMRTQSIFIKNETNQNLICIQVLGPEPWGEVRWVGNMKYGREGYAKFFLHGYGPVNLRFIKSGKSWTAPIYKLTSGPQSVFVRVEDEGVFVGRTGNEYFGIYSSPAKWEKTEAKIEVAKEMPDIRID